MYIACKYTQEKAGQYLGCWTLFPCRLGVDEWSGGKWTPSLHRQLLTSPRLYLTLYNKGVNCCGTVKTNRKGFPKETVKSVQKPDRGYMEYT